MAVVQILIFDTPESAGYHCDFQPAVGQQLTLAQSLAIDALRHFRHLPRLDGLTEQDTFALRQAMKSCIALMTRPAEPAPAAPEGAGVLPAGPDSGSAAHHPV